MAPDGTAWARELKAAAADAARDSHGEIEVKWYLGGVAGDEVQALERIRRGQLDGAAGASFCERLAPSLRVLRIPGLVQNRAEGRFIIGRLRHVFDEEFARAGFVDLFVEPFGLETIFSRTPIASVKDLQTNRVWVWELAETLLRSLRQMGLNVVSLPLEAASRAYDDHRVDVFIGVPTAALAYQWGWRAHYFTPLNLALLPGCGVVTQQAFDEIGIESQRMLRAVVAKMAIRFDDLGRMEDEALLGGLLEKQGIKRVPVSQGFRDEFRAAARAARFKDPVVPPALIVQVDQWLADYRAAHGSSATAGSHAQSSD